MERLLERIDIFIIRTCRLVALPLARFSIFIIFFWFGALKVLDLSQASSLVGGLLQKTLPFISFPNFFVGLGLYEMIVGIIFLIPSWTRLAISLLMLHMLTTFLPLVLLPETTWQGFLTPTLEGQYIIKNIVITSLAICLAVYVRPFHRNKNKRV